MYGTYIALLRGINVSGHNKLPMKELAALFADAGCSAVETYIQSGNVVFMMDESRADSVPGLISSAIAERFGYTIPVVMRTAQELLRVVDGNPYADGTIDPRLLQVGFLATEPDPGRVAALNPGRSPPDEFTVSGRQIYLRFPNGSARSKLTNGYFDSQLATVSTMRNWNTVLKLSDLASERR